MKRVKQYFDLAYCYCTDFDRQSHSQTVNPYLITTILLYSTVIFVCYIFVAEEFTG